MDNDYMKLRDEIDRLLSLEKDGKICAGLYATVAEFQHIKAALSLAADAGRYREAYFSEREDNLWDAYNSGHVKDGRWSHLFMSDGEWLAQECGFDPCQPDYDDAEIRAAIPVVARQALQGEA